MALNNLIRATHELCQAVSHLTFGSPITHVYNPLLYAWENYETYLNLYAEGTKKAIFLGMNPGPWGMAQTGVPFGDPPMVRDWLKITHPVGKPAHEHPQRHVDGINCPRREVSGTRLWGAARDHFGTPQRFFQFYFVANYCPLCFLEKSARNRTPDKLPVAEQTPLFEACDLYLRRTVEEMTPQFVIGVGAFAAARARQALEGLGITIGQILHPSPANPMANRGWSTMALQQLKKLGVCDSD